MDRFVDWLMDRFVHSRCLVDNSRCLMDNGLVMSMSRSRISLSFPMMFICNWSVNWFVDWLMDRFVHNRCLVDNGLVMSMSRSRICLSFPVVVAKRGISLSLCHCYTDEASHQNGGSKSSQHLHPHGCRA